LDALDDARAAEHDDRRLHALLLHDQLGLQQFELQADRAQFDAAHEVGVDVRLPVGVGTADRQDAIVVAAVTVGLTVLAGAVRHVGGAIDRRHRVRIGIRAHAA
jgi:hypothetical protein